ncbi:MAG: hypothetical protein NWF01_02445 [Candidatus Bathyarchaeota archaeon]|nr:hypothetical protein [Candidatus Bathyarchaeota archaeon]
MKEEKAIPKQNNTQISATRIIASTLGAIVGLAGMEHGFFEILQGNTTPSDLVIDAIGPAQKFWIGATEPAFTVIPNFFISGLLAVLVGLVVTIWAVAFVQKRYGPLVLLLLCLVLFLVGGGTPPLVLGVVASAVATRINKPLNWWNAHLGGNSANILAKLWPWTLILFVIMFWFSVAIAIFGWPLTMFDAEGTNSYTILSLLGYVSDIVMILVVVTGIAYDVKRRREIIA